MSGINKPETPPHTLDALELEIKKASTQAKTGAKFINLDSRVLGWLITDSRALTEAWNEASE